MTVSDAPLCDCHGQPMYWHADRRKRRGGWFECAARRRERQRRAYAADPEKARRRQRERYDNDPIWRISKNLKNDALKRAQTIQRKREELDGQVSQQG